MITKNGIKNYVSQLVELKDITMALDYALASAQNKKVECPVSVEKLISLRKKYAREYLAFSGEVIDMVRDEFDDDEMIKELENIEEPFRELANDQ